MKMFYLFSFLSASGIGSILPIIHSDTHRVELKSSLSVRCPKNGGGAISFSAKGTQSATVIDVRSNDNEISVEEKGLVDAWLKEAGQFDYATIGCTDDGVVVNVQAAQNDGDKFKPVSLLFMLRNGHVVGRTIRDNHDY